MEGDGENTPTVASEVCSSAMASEALELLLLPIPVEEK